MVTEAQRRGEAPTKYFTCEVDGCPYTSDAGDPTLARHLRGKHGRSSAGISMEEFIGEGFIAMLSEHVEEHLRSLQPAPSTPPIHMADMVTGQPLCGSDSLHAAYEDADFTGFAVCPSCADGGVVEGPTTPKRKGSEAAQAARKYRAALKQAKACNEAALEYPPSRYHDGCDAGKHMYPAIQAVCAGELVAEDRAAGREWYRYDDGSEIAITDYDARVTRRAE